jgi:hypothetical protein
MNRRTFVAGTFALLAAPLAAGAQSKRPHRIGYISIEPAPTADVPAIGLEHLRQALVPGAACHREGCPR